jgi:very-short-patch-repair endonuclease
VGKKQQDLAREAWDLVRMQHGVVARAQLIELGLGSRSIEHRIAKGRLYPLWRGVYAVGRPEVSQEGRWMAAVLVCGPTAVLSHRSAAALWGIARVRSGMAIEVTAGTWRRRPGIRVHRRRDLGSDNRHEVSGIPVTDLVSTLVDLASCTPDWQVERAISEADRLDLADPEALRANVSLLGPRPGMSRLRRTLGLDALTDTGLERKFLAIVAATGLPRPETQAHVNGYRVDFYWLQLRLVVETDGWRYHRTSGEQSTDRRRDQTHMTTGLTTIRFGEDQIRYEPEYVRRTLAAVIARLERGPRR